MPPKKSKNRTKPPKSQVEPAIASSSNVNDLELSVQQKMEMSLNELKQRINVLKSLLTSYSVVEVQKSLKDANNSAANTPSNFAWFLTKIASKSFLNGVVAVINSVGSAFGTLTTSIVLSANAVVTLAIISGLIVGTITASNELRDTYSMLEKINYYRKEHNKKAKKYPIGLGVIFIACAVIFMVISSFSLAFGYDKVAAVFFAFLTGAPTLANMITVSRPLKRELAELEEKKSTDIETSLQDKEDRINELQANLSALNVLKVQLEAELLPHEPDETFNELETQLELIKLTLENQQLTIKQQKENMGTLNNELVTKDDIIIKKDGIIGEKEDAITTLKQDVSDISRKKEALEKELVEAKAKITQLEVAAAKTKSAEALPSAESSMHPISRM